MPRPTTSVVLQGFSGLNTSPVAAEIGDTQASVLDNLYIDPRQGRLVQRNGQTVLSGTPSPDQSLDMVAWHKLADTEYLLYMLDGNLYDKNTGSVVSGGTLAFASEGETNSVWFNNVVLFGNGIDSNKRFNGGNLIRDAVQQALVNTVTLSGSLSPGNPNGTYRYKIVFLNGDGIEGEASEATSGVTVSVGKIVIQGIPVCPAGQNCGARSIYRTADAGAEYFYVDTIPDNTTTVYVDNISDSDLGDSLDEGRVKFPPVRYLVEHEGRVFGAYCLSPSGDTFTLYVSDKFDHTVCRVITDETSTIDGGRFQLNDQAAGVITGLGRYGSVVMVFTGGRSYLFVGNQPSNFALTFFSDVGCTSHRSIVSTRTQIMWLASDGVYTWSGGAIERISEDVREIIEALTASEMSQASALIYDGRYHLFFPTFALVYDLVSGAWTKNTNVKYRDTTISTYTTDSKPRLWGGRYGSSQIWKLEDGALDSTSGIVCRYSTKDMNFGRNGRDTRVYSYSALLRAQATTQTLSGSLVKGTGLTVKTATKDLSDTAVDGATIVRFEQAAPEQARDEFFRLEFACNSTSGTFEILNLSLEVEKVE